MHFTALRTGNCKQFFTKLALKKQLFSLYILYIYEDIIDMTFVNAFTQFNRGFLNGAGFGLGIGMSSILNRVFFDINRSLNPFFSCNPFNSYFGGFNNYYEYDLGMLNFSQNFSSCADSSIWNFNTTVPQQTSGFDTFGALNTFNLTMPVVPQVTTSKKTEDKKDAKKEDKPSPNLNPNGSHAYEVLSRESALKRAKANPNLEELTKGEGWSISEGSFINDIPYARKGTSALLNRVCKEAGVTLTVTSALGTKNSPHAATSSAASHYNENNPKLDLGGGLTDAQAKELKSKLDKTGLFSRVAVESDGATSHLDVQFSDEAYKTV